MQNIKNEKIWWEKLSKPALTDSCRCVSQLTLYGDKHTRVHTHPPHASWLSTDFILKSYSLIRPMFAKSKVTAPCKRLLEIRASRSDTLLWDMIALESWKDSMWTAITPPHHIVTEAGICLLMPYASWFLVSWPTAYPPYHSNTVHSFRARMVLSQCQTPLLRDK